MIKKRTSKLIRKKQTISGREVEFIYKISNTKNSYIRLNRNNEIVVTISRYSSPKQMGKFISENIDRFINAIENKELKKRFDICYNYFHSGGKKINIKWVIGKRNKVLKEADDSLVIQVCNHKQKEKFILNWLIKTNYDKFYETYKKCCQQVGVQIPVSFKRLISRWGYYSCTKQNIVLSSYLLMFETNCWEYVLIHELCHHFENNHSKRFWQLVESYFPDYKIPKNVLNFKNKI